MEKKTKYTYDHLCSAKPGFFHDENRANLFEVEPETGMLLNTDNGTRMPQVCFKGFFFFLSF